MSEELVSTKERDDQNDLIKFFENTLGYEYLGNLQYEVNTNLKSELLEKYLLRQDYEKGVDKRVVVKRAITKLEGKLASSAKSLYEQNKKIYDLLKYGVGVTITPSIEDTNKNTRHLSVHLIDFANPLNNDFYIAKEVTIVEGETTKRPDLVLYINGIALAVFELKSGNVEINDAVRQNIRNFALLPKFFTTIALVVAASSSAGLKYGCINTPLEYFLKWKDDKARDKNLDMKEACKLMFNKEVFCELIASFMLFDNGVKKAPRPHQYYALKAAQRRLARGEGGVIWHSQGSGKSITMVYLAKWILEHKWNLEHLPKKKVLILTDRVELDSQIKGLFINTGETIIKRCESGKEMQRLLEGQEAMLICSLMHKFRPFLDELEELKPLDMKDDVVIFIDECHRTQSGRLHKAMKKLLPNSCIIGFSGTPLLKRDKISGKGKKRFGRDNERAERSSAEVFGSYIHEYKYDEAVSDKVVLELRYEARDIEQSLGGNEERIDEYFDRKTAGLTPAKKKMLQDKWANLKRLYSSKDRLEKIAFSIIEDLDFEPLSREGATAILACDNIESAFKIYDIFRTTAELKGKCAVVTSRNEQEYKNALRALNGECGIKASEHEAYKRMLEDLKLEERDFEAEVKRRFKETPKNMKLLIVVDKLLTGFDAPSASTLYIDKKMKNHGLFQAICRVNRLDGEGKTYGKIVDFKDLFFSIGEAVSSYTDFNASNEGDEGTFAKSDVDGLLVNYLERGKEKLKEAREDLKYLVCEVPMPRDDASYYAYFSGKTAKEIAENEEKRVLFYSYVNKYLTSYANIAGDLRLAGFSDTEVGEIKRELKYYTDMKAKLKQHSGDALDEKEYEAAMKGMLDMYIEASSAKVLSDLGGKGLLEVLKKEGAKGVLEVRKEASMDEEAMLDAVINNTRRELNEELEKKQDAQKYERLSDQLQALIDKHKIGALEYKELLEAIDELLETSRGNSLGSAGLDAICGNITDGDEEKARKIDEFIKTRAKDGWQDNKSKELQLLQPLKEKFPNVDANALLALAKNYPEYLK